MLNVDNSNSTFIIVISHLLQVDFWVFIMQNLISILSNVDSFISFHLSHWFIPSQLQTGLLRLYSLFLSLFIPIVNCLTYHTSAVDCVHEGIYNRGLLPESIFWINVVILGGKKVILFYHCYYSVSYWKDEQENYLIFCLVGIYLFHRPENVLKYKITNLFRHHYRFGRHVFISIVLSFWQNGSALDTSVVKSFPTYFPVYKEMLLLKFKKSILY